MTDREKRLARLEDSMGFVLPLDYRSFLSAHDEDPGRPHLVVSSNPDYLGVRHIFELSDGAGYLQVDEVHRLVGDVLPSGMMAVADDHGGNLYLLDRQKDAATGSVYWWSLEQGPGEDRVELVARSFSAFLQSLVPEPDD